MLRTPEFAGVVDCPGFVSGPAKERALREADLFCFPTRYSGENQPVTLIEAMAFGLPIVTTRWRSIPVMFPPGYSGRVAGQSAGPIADALLALMMAETGEGLWDIFLRNFTLERYLSGLAEAFKQVEPPSPATVAAAPAGALPS